MNDLLTHRFSAIQAPLGLLLLLLCAVGCTDRGAVSVRLQARPAADEPLSRFEINAQISGPPAGLRYKWFSVSGEFQPQESELPRTIFTLPDGVKQDRVSVEVWRGDRQVGQSEIKVKFDDERARTAQERLPEVQIEITRIPPADLGGPDTHADIAGKVSGSTSPDYRVAIYARAYGNWHIQPYAQDLHKIGSDNTWAAWTHTGSGYAALLVRSNYNPIVRLEVLPAVGGYVLARTVVDGVARPPTNSTATAGASANDASARVPSQ